MKRRIGIIFLCILISQIAGCSPNYREIEKLSIVSGIAIDQDEESSKFVLTFELVDIISSGNQVQITSRLLESTGDTVFEAIRNTIRVSAKRLYFSHLKVLVISNKVAQEGMVPVLNLMDRDGEPRYDIDLIISEGSAANILKSGKEAQIDNVCFNLSDTIQAQNSLGKAPKVDMWQFLNDVSAKDVSAITPIVNLEENNDKMIPRVNGTAIFKGDKMIGALSGDETHIFLFIINKIGNALYIVHDFYKSDQENVALEIFKAKTKMTPIIKEDEIIMDIEVNLQVSIGENLGHRNLNEKANREELVTVAEKELEGQITDLVQKVQRDYGSDIFGFGKRVRIDSPRLWAKIKDDWEYYFKLVSVRVKVNIDITNSGFEYKPVDIGL